MTRSAPVVVLVIAAALYGCRGERPRSVAAFAVVRTTPAIEAGSSVLLNQELTVYFSAPIDPLSITSDTVRVLDATGHHIDKARLRTTSHSVSFVPAPPLSPDLLDGGLRPDSSYRLMVAGYPADNAVKSRDGRVLSASLTVPFRTVPAATAALGLPSPLLPVGQGLQPFLLRSTEVLGRVPADAAVVRLQFTLPVLPTSLSSRAVSISLLRKSEERLRRIEPHGMRLLSQPPPIDDYPGCTLEIDLGRKLVLEGGTGGDHLQPRDMLVVELLREAPITDYAGHPVLSPDQPVRWFEVVAGASLVLAEWPLGSRAWPCDEPMWPGFEVLRSGLRPRVRVEAGAGDLGVFRPRRDTELRPGVPFDRGDGTMVVGPGDVFPFLLIDIPRGVTVRVTGAGRPMALLACGSIRIDGVLELDCPGFEMRPATQAGGCSPRALLDSSGVCVVAGGDLVLAGSIRPAESLAEPGSDRLSLTLMAAGRIALAGSIPPRTWLAFECDQPATGTAEPETSVPVELTPGLPAGATLEVSAVSPWVALPPDRVDAEVEIDTPVPGVQVMLQFAPPDASGLGRPDPLVERWSQPRAVFDGMPVDFPAGSLVRVLLLTQVTGGSPPPVLRAIRLRAR